MESPSVRDMLCCPLNSLNALHDNRKGHSERGESGGVSRIELEVVMLLSEYTRELELTYFLCKELEISSSYEISFKLRCEAQ